MIIWKKLDRFEAHPNPEALLKKVAIGRAIDHIRSELKRKKRERDMGLPPKVLENAERRFDQDLQQESLQTAIGRLPKKQAMAVLLRLVEEQPYPLIAETMNCSEATVRTHVKRGRLALQRKLSHFIDGR